MPKLLHNACLGQKKLNFFFVFEIPIFAIAVGKCELSIRLTGVFSATKPCVLLTALI